MYLSLHQVGYNIEIIKQWFQKFNCYCYCYCYCLVCYMHGLAKLLAI